MEYSYWADGDWFVYRLPANDPDPYMSHDAEVFAYESLDWIPYGSIASEHDAQPVSKDEAMRVCDLISQRAAKSHASA